MDMSTVWKVCLMDPKEDFVYQKPLTLTRDAPVVHTVLQFGIEAAEEAEDNVILSFTCLNDKMSLTHTYS